MLYLSSTVDLFKHECRLKSVELRLAQKMELTFDLH